MAETSKIEWTDSTWNVVTGCSVVSPGCTNCYAMRLAGTRMQHHPSRAGLTKPSKAGPVWTGEVRFNEDWLDQPLRWRRPRMIFVCAHGDLFHESVPDAWIDRVFAVMALAPQHTFQVLTKRSARMRAYVSQFRAEGRYVVADRITSRDARDGNRFLLLQEGQTWPIPNVWLGVSVEDQRRADERIPDLLSTPAAIRFVSAEPLLGPIDLSGYMWPVHPRWPARYASPEAAKAAGAEVTYHRQRLVHADCAFTDWVIAGGESGPGARPMHPDWARSLRDQCKAAGVAFHFKQWGAWVPEALAFRDCWPADRWHEWPAEVSPTHRMPAAAIRVGKKGAGRLLDGRTWDQMPEVAP